MCFRFILFNMINFIVIFIIPTHYKRNIIINKKDSTCFEDFDNSVLLHFKMLLFALFPFRDALFYFFYFIFKIKKEKNLQISI